DVRLTHFTDNDGAVTYFGTYTAYNGFRILPQLFETQDFSTIEIHTLNGRYVQNKGMALFPRKIDGFYHMISRLDGENMFLMKSDNVHFWNECQKLAAPLYPWEFVQIGNCGPPIETEHGWLLLTHGVGPVRQYCIGACLLDLDDPSKVIGHLDQPLIIPNQEERDGYVPNVVYTCGALAHAGHLVIPYAMSDSATTFATVKMGELMDQLTNHSKSCPVPDRRVAAR
ncbi:MAG: glycosidase, partial [Planctomycetota bacterium]